MASEWSRYVNFYLLIWTSPLLSIFYSHCCRFLLTCLIQAKPGWRDPKEFGFTNRDYQFNRGHYKYFSNENGEPEGYTVQGADGKIDVTKKGNYATDFLFDRGIEHIEDAIKRDDKFAVVLSIPGELIVWISFYQLKTTI